MGTRKKIAQTEKKTKMSTDQKRSGCGKYMAGAALVAAGAGVYYYHKDMTKEELREAGQTYMETTQEYSSKAYQAAKPVAIAACEKALSSPGALTPNSRLPSTQSQSLRLMRKNTIRTPFRRKHPLLSKLSMNRRSNLSCKALFRAFACFAMNYE